MTGRVITEGDLIQLWADGRLLDEQRQNNLARIYDVFAGSDISIANPDTNFYVFAFLDKLWLLPENTEGVPGVIFRSWRDLIVKSKLYYFAHLDALPQEWRKPWMGGLFRMPEPQLLVLPPTDLPNWRLRGPLDPETLRPFEAAVKNDLNPQQ